MNIREFSKRRIWEKASLEDERTKILHEGIKIKKENDENLFQIAVSVLVVVGCSCTIYMQQ